MARKARLKIESGEGWYHLFCRTAGFKGDMPLNKRGASRKFADLLRHFGAMYFCDIASFCVMGNHYHIVVRFHERFDVSKSELKERAKDFYPNSHKILAGWRKAQWKRFEERLFDVSELMRNVHMAYARWYNKQFKRTGRFWAERFKSTILGDSRSVLNCMLYTELNPVRAGLIERPEDWEGSSYHFRNMRKDEWLLSLEEVMNSDDIRSARRDYRALLYYRGSVNSKEKKDIIPDHILEQEIKRGFKERGAYRKQMKHFKDGLVLGSEEYIQDWLDRLRKNKYYTQRINPVQHKELNFSSIR